jgi:hypothetical protein
MSENNKTREAVRKALNLPKMEKDVSSKDKAKNALKTMLGVKDEPLAKHLKPSKKA